MDGNRRWAREKGIPLVVGHTKGYRQIEPVAKRARKLGIKYLTLWAFSTENWNRDKAEVEYLMNIFRRIFKSSLIKRIITEGTKINILGEITPFPQDIKINIRKIIEESKENEKLILNIALNYGGRDEIIRAVNKIVNRKRRKLDEKTFSKYLDTKNQPDPDLIIRTGGDQRLSGFLPWQSVYSELYFTETYWPDFGSKEFDKAIEKFNMRDRRFGK